MRRDDPSDMKICWLEVPLLRSARVLDRFTTCRGAQAFAALNVAVGRAIGKSFARHRAREFLKSLRGVESGVLPDLDIHPVLLNSSTRKTPKIRSWTLRHPRGNIHFASTFHESAKDILASIERLRSAATKSLTGRRNLLKTSEMGIWI